MAGAYAAFGSNDLKGVRRDPLLAFVVFSPFCYAGLVAIPTGPVTGYLADRFGFDLVPYYPLIMTSFLTLGCAMIVAALAALLILDERDAGTLTALRVVPVPMRAFVGYRATTIVLVTTLYIVVSMVISGFAVPALLPARLLPVTVLHGLLAGLSAVVVALLMVSVAHNKVEGLAVMRGVGILVVGLPCLPFFIHNGWQFAFGVLPTYWPSAMFWAAARGETWWPYLLIGVAYHIALIVPLYRRFARTAG
ncbi:ABC transporter permease [Fodinicola acaciae]|uniref:ABC transporter permease n=1 Tax=Fodinicola acaciae TaxID=2681555 RepID=UPI0013D62CF7|nr:ABC transporter permease [Fodinicola acaciae]